jgi:hypothetical protein
VAKIRKGAFATETSVLPFSCLLSMFCSGLLHDRVDDDFHSIWQSPLRVAAAGLLCIGPHRRFQCLRGQAIFRDRDSLMRFSDDFVGRQEYHIISGFRLCRRDSRLSLWLVQDQLAPPILRADHCSVYASHPLYKAGTVGFAMQIF